MAKFCTKCGTPAGADAKFCESCGALLPAAVAAMASHSPANPVRVALPIPPAKIAKIGAAGAVSLLVLGGGIWFLVKAPSPPSASALSVLLNADKQATEQRVCLDNFPYDKDPVYVNGNNAPTKDWLSVLVRAGIYNPPEEQNTGGWFPQTQYKFTHTANGQKAIRNGKLCFAEGIAVDKVEYSEPHKVNDKTYVDARYTYHYANPAAWINDPVAKQVDGSHFGQSSFDNGVTLALEDGKWKPSSGRAEPGPRFGAMEQAKLFSTLGHAATEGTSSASGGFWTKIKSFFSGMGGNPLIGKWELDSEKMGMGGVGYTRGQQFEFTSDEMRAGPSITKVKYEVRGSEVLVAEASGNNASAFTVIDHDHIALNMGMGNLYLRRVN